MSISIIFPSGAQPYVYMVFSKCNIKYKKFMFWLKYENSLVSRRDLFVSLEF